MHELQSFDTTKQLMFDKSFNLSRKYFTLLQILRLSSELVEDPNATFKSLRREFDITARFQHGDYTRKLSREYWDRADAKIDGAFERVRNRMNRKIEEIKSLRDGVIIQSAKLGMSLMLTVCSFSVPLPYARPPTIWL